VYGDLSEELSAIPFMVAKINRNETNSGLLGFLTDVDFVIYDTVNKTQNRMKSIPGIYIAEDYASEKLKLELQKFGLLNIVGSILVINYVGLYNLSTSTDQLSSGKMIEVKISETGNTVLMLQFHIENDILSANVSGLRAEEGLVREEMGRI
jgi:hypothetical protein